MPWIDDDIETVHHEPRHTHDAVNTWLILNVSGAGDENDATSACRVLTYE